MWPGPNPNIYKEILALLYEQEKINWKQSLSLDLGCLMRCGNVAEIKDMRNGCLCGWACLFTLPWCGWCLSHALDWVQGLPILAQLPQYQPSPSSDNIKQKFNSRTICCGSVRAVWRGGRVTGGAPLLKTLEEVVNSSKPFNTDVEARPQHRLVH